jgi:hypothetical protein
MFVSIQVRVVEKKNLRERAISVKVVSVLDNEVREGKSRGRAGYGGLLLVVENAHCRWGDGTGSRHYLYRTVPTH